MDWQDSLSKSDGDLSDDELEYRREKLRLQKELLDLKARRQERIKQKRRIALTRENSIRESTPNREDPTGEPELLEIPATPEKPRSATQSPLKSPARVRLGLDRKIKPNQVNLSKKSRSESELARRSTSNSTTDLTDTREPEGTKAPQLSYADKILQNKKLHTERAQAVKELKEKRVNSFGTVSQVDIDLGNGIEYEEYTKLRLRKRTTEKAEMSKITADMKMMTIHELQKHVSPPKFEEPPFLNWVVIGVLASKSDVRFGKNGRNDKFVVWDVCNLHDATVPLVLRNDALEKYWTTPTGAVIAILNPGIYVKQDKNGYTFGLNIHTDDNALLQIGVAQDFGNCKAITAKGTQCHNWINTHKTEYCEFHIDVGMKRARSNRQELNSAPTKSYAPTTTAARAGNGSAAMSSLTGNRSKKPRTDRYSGNNGGVFTVAASTKAKFLDDVGEKRLSTAELDALKRKRAKDRAREYELRMKLAKRKDGYLMREYSDKGIPLLTVEDQEQQDLEREETLKVFTAKRIRAIGYNPAKHIEKDKKTSTDWRMGMKNTLDNVSLERPKRPKSVVDKPKGESSDELEFVSDDGQ